MSLSNLFVKIANAAEGGAKSGTTPSDEKFRLPNPLDFTGEKSLWTIVANVIDIVLIIVGLVAFGYLLYGGVLFLTSGGDADKVTNARNTIMYAIIGIVVVILSYAIFNWVRTLL